MKLLLSGFEPFGGMKVNPTEQLMQDMAAASITGVDIRTVLLPVYFDECAEILLQAVEKFQPDVIISCGLAAGRTSITPERIAINVKDIAPDASYPDNRGTRPQDEPIDPDGPDGLFSGLPVRDMVSRLQAAGIPAAVSNTAGTYICNNTMYAVLNYIRRHQLPVLAGFVHVPASSDMAADKPSLPSLPYDMLLRGLKLIIESTRTAWETRAACQL
ncbi:pyroglutamyl-peptidase I [Paenibacillus sp. JX-17]|uniref:Pyrrolidone-carboxylate peptidase n=1 Tax=Paenibacillus lacisoli TaxID=3064525 RepID=A0ABT9CE33_9BACL|nr:pyroglutamyl-peptidase I [Paenibacillus sp. JX-17]MDO7907507.1 pyroglutamyl-peptidase I [Paenibacillus sp. JX-17]